HRPRHARTFARRGPRRDGGLGRRRARPDADARRARPSRLAFDGPVDAMPFRDIHGAALTSIIAAVITLGPALDAGQTGLQSVQYRSPEGVEYRSLPDTDAVKSARAAFEASPRNIARIIDLGVAQSGARQFREAIATF